MPDNIYLLLFIAFASVVVLFFLSRLSPSRSLGSIRSKRSGDGQHGTARWATKKEIRKTYVRVPFTPAKWRARQDKDQKILYRCRLFAKKRPLPEGIIAGYEKKRGPGSRVYAYIDTGDVHCLTIGAAGSGKTACWLYPNLEYAMACGMSFLTTDTKGDLLRRYGGIAERDYGYKIAVIDLRNPTNSHGGNLLHLVSKYMDEAARNNDLSARGRAEKYAKIIAKTIIGADGGENFGENAYFYDAAEGLLTSCILLLCEFCPPETRHIVSVFKILQDMMQPGRGRKNAYRELLDLLPENHKARWFAGAALNASDQAMASVMSTALSKLNAFLDSELETILCRDPEIDAELFAKTKCAMFVIMPEEDSSKYFMVSLMIQQWYRELLSVADEYGGKLPRRAIFFCDEFGTLPKIQSAEMMFSASRSRRLSIVPIIQSFAQLQKNYGKEGAEIIVDNTQLTIFGGFSPNAKSAAELSAGMGNATVTSGSVSQNDQGTSRTLQLMQRALLTPDELKSLPRGTFIVTRTGCMPNMVRMPLFFEWGIRFDGEPFKISISCGTTVSYAGRMTLRDAVENSCMGMR
ncbi:MAG: type IV secretory system conjugative DNA transfer family protein [Clostridia bacterium]|nr:type IV secretory system conjugative DNA transfer family protein [Clostridia bacterium]